MDTTKLYRLNLVDGAYPVELGVCIKAIYDETETGDLVPVTYYQTDIPEAGRSIVNLCHGARGPLRVKYRKAK